MTSFSIPSSILEQVVKLNDGDNWHTWQSQIMMALQSDESDKIVSGDSVIYIILIFTTPRRPSHPDYMITYTSTYLRSDDSKR